MSLLTERTYQNPLICMLQGVLVLPLIGHLNAQRAAHLMTTVLPTI